MKEEHVSAHPAYPAAGASNLRVLGTSCSVYMKLKPLKRTVTQEEELDWEGLRNSKHEGPCVLGALSGFAFVKHWYWVSLDNPWGPSGSDILLF